MNFGCGRDNSTHNIKGWNNQNDLEARLAEAEGYRCQEMGENLSKTEQK